MFNEKLYADLANIIEDLQKTDSTLDNPTQSRIDENSLKEHHYQDPQVEAGNKFAYNHFVKNFGKSGSHVHFDINHLSSVNKDHGYEFGDHAVKQVFHAASELAKKYDAPLFRYNGDEGRFFLPNREKAQSFMKDLDLQLQAVEALKGTNHKLSISIGAGHTPQHAEEAIKHSKHASQKLEAGKSPNQTTSLLHEPFPADWHPVVTPPSAIKVNQHPSALKLANPLKPQG